MVEAPINRIKEHLREATPATRQGRGDNYIDTLQLALDTLRGLMTSFNPDMQYKAVVTMLDFEKTRIRHGRPLASMDTADPIEPMPEKQSTKQQEPIINKVAEEEDQDVRRLTKSEQESFERVVDELLEFCQLKSDVREPFEEKIESPTWNGAASHRVDPVDRCGCGATLDWPG